MASDFSQPPIVPVPNAQPFYVRRRQGWAISQERQRHTQALLWTGEPALFVLMWKVEDFEAGYCTRCQRCRQTDGSLNARIENVYKQPLNATCPYCFGTTFAGGVRAKIIRPAIFTDADEDEKKSARGVIHPEQLTVETTEDFRSRSGDFVFRQDGSRWQLSTPSRVQLRTGFKHPTQEHESIGYARIQAAREARTSVAFQIPPNSDELKAWLEEPMKWPAASSYDTEMGPLIPTYEIG